MRVPVPAPIPTPAPDPAPAPTTANARVVGFGCPKAGQYYWDRGRHLILRADRDMGLPFLLLERGEEMEVERPTR